VIVIDQAGRKIFLISHIEVIHHSLPTGKIGSPIGIKEFEANGKKNPKGDNRIPRPAG